jgi:cardiolipin synthase
MFASESRAFGFGVFHFALAALVTIHALLRKRDVPAAIGWIGMAWLAPVFGPLLYFAFGINRVRRRAQRLKGAARGGEAPRPGGLASVGAIERLAAAVGAITGQERAVGEVVEILHCGDEAYPRMLAAIEDAKFSIRLATYIFRADELGRQFVAALARAQARGVATRVLIDGFGGGFIFSTAYRALRGQGVPTARFLHSVMPWKMPFLDLRLHKKCLAVDGAIVFVGGLNIARENLMAARPRSPVRDVHFRVEGTVARQIEQQFDDDWAFTTGEAPIDVPTARIEKQNSGASARAIVSGPDQDVDQIVLVLLSAIQSARRSIRIITPYFLPDEQILTALRLAALRGVEVHVVVPTANNHILVAWAMPAHIRPLLRTGVRVWRGPPPFDHTKLMTVDDEWSLIGSANWDIRSLRLNFELTMELYGMQIATQLSQIIDSRRIQPITPEEIDARPYLIQLRDAAARLAMPYI